MAAVVVEDGADEEDAGAELEAVIGGQARPVADPDQMGEMAAKGLSANK